jgi:hypothetical protein
VLGVVENDVRVILFLKRFARYLIARADEIPHHRLVADDLDIAGQVGEMGQAVGEVRDRRNPAYRFQRAFTFSILRRSGSDR